MEMRVTEVESQMAQVYVCFWFDVEDYVTPQSDDAVMRLARTFSEAGESATFKIVGEKARRLRERGREDVIAAVAEHDIGYHTDFHSVHPTVSEYLEGLGWDEGIEEFDRRERQGMEDVEELFGKRCSTYGQPGGSWAPQVYPALRRWGIPTYVDEATHVGLNDQPFWYCRVLNVLRMRSRCTRMKLGGGDSLREACDAFDSITQELQGEGGGLISIYYHPCEWSTTRFWDGVNFAKGHNTPLNALALPPLKPEDQAERDFKDFAAYVRHVSESGARVVTAAELPVNYPDLWNSTPLSSGLIVGLADAVADSVTYQPVERGWVSAAEAFGVLVETAACVKERGGIADGLTGRYVDGPIARPSVRESCEVTPDDFVAACARVSGELRLNDRVPSEVRVGGHVVGPAAFARAAARLLLRIAHGARPSRIGIEDRGLECESEVVEQGAFGWSIFPEGFSAPQLMELARLQAWTLKPALLHF